MKLENQVISLDLAITLKRLGVKQESVFYHWATEIEPDGLAWWNVLEKEPRKGKKVREYLESVGRPSVLSAFTVAELGEMLPLLADSGKTIPKTSAASKGKWVAIYDPEGKNRSLPQYADTEADARAKMLVYLLENNLMTVAP